MYRSSHIRCETSSSSSFFKILVTEYLIHVAKNANSNQNEVCELNYLSNFLHNILMPSMVKCESCGFEFPSRSVSFTDRQSFETGSVPNNNIEEICPQCNKTMIIRDKSAYIWRD
jgi:predicted RNA-binding Zn-ribbon protein involved in translation (DUF1610 family)